MITIEVLGPGCANCKRLEQVTIEAVAAAGLEAEVIHITDHGEIMERGVLSTPGLVIDGKVVSVGRVPSQAEIAGWLTPS